MPTLADQYGEAPSVDPSLAPGQNYSPLAGLPGAAANIASNAAQQVYNVYQHPTQTLQSIYGAAKQIPSAITKGVDALGKIAQSQPQEIKEAVLNPIVQDTKNLAKQFVDADYAGKSAILGSILAGGIMNVVPGGAELKAGERLLEAQAQISPGMKQLLLAYNLKHPEFEKVAANLESKHGKIGATLDEANELKYRELLAKDPNFSNVNTTKCSGIARKRKKRSSECLRSFKKFRL